MSVLAEKLENGLERHTLDAADLDYFEKQVRKFAALYGIADGKEIYVKCNPNLDTAGECYYDTMAQHCGISIAPHVLIAPLSETVRRELDRIAEHEVLEALLMDVKAIARSRSFDDDDLMKEVHRVINCLMSARKKE